MTSNILVVEARYYEDISDALLEGAMQVLDAAGANVSRVIVPGALEIPHIISYANDVRFRTGKSGFDGYVALGCVIRGETSHYDYVCGESARGLMDLSIKHHLAIGNGIITVENEDQAWARARVGQKNKGGFAAATVMSLLDIHHKLHMSAHSKTYGKALINDPDA